VLTGPIATQGFEAIAWRTAQVVEPAGDLELPQLAAGHPFEGLKARHAPIRSIWLPSSPVRTEAAVLPGAFNPPPGPFTPSAAPRATTWRLSSLSSSSLIGSPASRSRAVRISSFVIRLPSSGIQAIGQTWAEHGLGGPLMQRFCCERRAAVQAARLVSGGTASTAPSATSHCCSWRGSGMPPVRAPKAGRARRSLRGQ